MNFISDNTAGAAPEIIDAVIAANQAHATPYGDDPLTAQATTAVREVFEAPEAAVFFVATGTAANALALASICPPWATIYCHRNSHIEEDECCAPEFFTGGAKLTLLGGENAKIDAAALRDALRNTASAGVHNAQPGALSITQATEAGTAYTPGEISELSAIAQEARLPVHMDGSRLSNALARQRVSPAEMTWKAGIDVLSLGATKNGALGVEAVILFDPARAWEFELRRKRGGQLFSKMRFLAAQMKAYLADGLWLRLATQANLAADLLAAGLAARNVPIIGEIGANILFAEITLDRHRALQAAGAHYYTMSPFDEDGPGDQVIRIRLVASFSTSEAEVDRFVSLL